MAYREVFRMEIQEIIGRRFFSLAGRLTRKARRPTLHLPQGWPWQNQFNSALARLRALPLPSCHCRGRLYPAPPNRLADPDQAGLRVSPVAIHSGDLALRRHLGPSTSHWSSCLDPHPPESGGVKALQPITLAYHPLNDQPVRALSPNQPKRWAVALPQGMMGRGRRTGLARFQ